MQPAGSIPACHRREESSKSDAGCLPSVGFRLESHSGLFPGGMGLFPGKPVGNKMGPVLFPEENQLGSPGRDPTGGSLPGVAAPQAKSRHQTRGRRTSKRGSGPSKRKRNRSSKGSKAKTREERAVERAKARREGDGGVHSCTKASCWSAHSCTHRRSGHPRKTRTVHVSASMHLPFRCCKDTTWTGACLHTWTWHWRPTRIDRDSGAGMHLSSN